MLQAAQLLLSGIATATAARLSPKARSCKLALASKSLASIQAALYSAHCSTADGESSGGVNAGSGGVGKQSQPQTPADGLCEDSFGRGRAGSGIPQKSGHDHDDRDSDPSSSDEDADKLAGVDGVAARSEAAAPTACIRSKANALAAQKTQSKQWGAWADDSDGSDNSDSDSARIVTAAGTHGMPMSGASRGTQHSNSSRVRRGTAEDDPWGVYAQLDELNLSSNPLGLLSARAVAEVQK